MPHKNKVVILGGGFAGLYTAIELEKLCRRKDEVEITLVNKENFFLFTPMLHEVAASDLEPANIVNPMHRMLSRTHFFCGKVESIDTKKKIVKLSHGNEHHEHEVSYDNLVVALGSVTHFHGLPGLSENALTMKSLGDAVVLRNRIIALLEEANFECCKDIRSRLLTFVVAGSGFAGVETVTAIHDLIYDILPLYRNLSKSDVRVVLASSSKIVLPELNEKLGIYAGKVMTKRGIEIRFETKVSAFENSKVNLSDGTVIDTCTVIWTAGNAANPLLATIPGRKEKGRIAVSESLMVPELDGVWALGDCAAIPDGNGNFYPPTAQHASRQGKIVARNIISYISGQTLRPFRFRMLGQLASLGKRRGVAEILGFRFQGFIAWWLWRSIYLLKLPRFERKCRVALDWSLDLVLSKDTCQLPVFRG